MEDLQRKVREHEAREVQATLEMQRAARVVALENSRLRSLLSSKGVSEDEVERYLASPGEGCQAPRREAAGSGCCSEGSGAPEDVAQRTSSSPASSRGAATEAGALTSLKRLVNERRPQPFDTLEREPERPATRARTAARQAQPSSESAPAPTSFHEMSCSAAAEIIAGAHGHGDACLARTVLGCVDSSNCVIRNTQVLQVLQNS